MNDLMDTLDIWIGLAGVAVMGLLIGGLLFLGYKMGQRHERGVLAKVVVSMTEATFDDGYNTGGKIGYQQGLKKGLATCDDIVKHLDDDGRY